MSRIVKISNRVYKKLNAKEFIDNEGNIDIQVSIDKSRQASDIAVISQEFADETALETSAKLSLTSKLSSTVASHNEDTSKAANTIAKLSSQAISNATTITDFSDSVSSFGEAIASWPLYTTRVHGYNERFRDESFNNITLTISGIDDPDYNFNNQVFFNFGTISSGITNTSFTDGSHALVNESEGDSLNLKISPRDPFSIECMLYYTNCASTGGYIVDFGNQYKFKVSSGIDLLTLEVNGVTTSNGITLSKNEWQYIMTSYDPINRIANFYKDGEFILRDSNIGIPGSIPNTNKIKIFSDIIGSLNKLKIYKAKLSDSTAETNFFTYTSRYSDSDTGGLFASGEAGGNLNLMINPSLGIADAKNISRHLYSSNVIFSGLQEVGNITSPVVYFPIYAAEYTKGIGANSWSKLAYVTFLKLTGENYLTLTGYSVTTGGASDFYISTWKSVGAQSINSGLALNINSASWFNLGLDISTLTNGALYTATIYARTRSDAQTGKLWYWSLIASNIFAYNQIGAGAGNPPTYIE